MCLESKVVIPAKQNDKEKVDLATNMYFHCSSLAQRWIFRTHRNISKIYYLYIYIYIYKIYIYKIRFIIDILFVIMGIGRYSQRSISGLDICWETEVHIRSPRTLELVSRSPCQWHLSNIHFQYVK